MALRAFGSVCYLGPICLCLSTSARAQEAADPLVSIGAAERADIDGYAEQALPSYGVPGAALAVLQGSKIVLESAYGQRAVGDAGRVTPRTRFMIGSLTKSMTGVMTATLVDDGLLDWDAKVTSLWPGFELSDPSSTALLTLRHLLTHSSGLPRYDIPLFVEYQRPRTLIQFLREIPSIAAPGQVYDYSNQGYAAGGFIASSVVSRRGESLYAAYARAMQQRVFDPLGLERTTLDFDRATTEPNHSLSHAYNSLSHAVEAVPFQLERFALPVAPAGAVWSDIHDMAVYANAQISGKNARGEPFVSAENLQQTHTGAIAINPNVSYGMGWLVATNPDGDTVLVHDGGTAGFTSYLLLVPNTGFAIAILTNAAGADDFTGALTQYVIEAARHLPHAGDAAIVSAHAQALSNLDTLVAETTAVSSDEVDLFLGDYEHNAQLTYDQEHGFRLLTDFAQFPLASLGEPGLYVTVGLVTGFAVLPGVDADGKQTLTIGGLGADAAVEDGWTLKKLSPEVACDAAFQAKFGAAAYGERRAKAAQFMARLPARQRGLHQMFH
jgi:CubicO group peptidase (beta-lactamase class C family)